MTRRLSAAIGALLLLATALVGLPAFLITVHQQLGGLLPGLADVPNALLAPGDGGLFLLTLIGIGWACWAVFALAFAVEVAARVRGTRTPRLGPFVPQRATGWAITAILLALTANPNPGPAHASTTTATQASVPSVASAPTRPAGQDRIARVAEAPTAAGDRDADGERWRDYRVKRGDTLWDIADRTLHDPTAWPNIAQASRDITQPGGERLTDPDHIEPSWTLHIPSASGQGTPRVTPHPDRNPTARRASDQPTEQQSTPEERTTSTPLRPPLTEPRPTKVAQDDGALPRDGAPETERSGSIDPSTAARGPVLPATPLRPRIEAGGADELVAEPGLGLPGWVRPPAKPTALHDSPETRVLVLRTLATDRGLG